MKQVLICIGLLSFVVSSQAQQLKVLADFGNTQVIGNETWYPKTEPVYTQDQMKKQVNSTLAEYFHVVTPELSVGKVTTRKINSQHIAQPFAIVGCDSTSMRWLKHYKGQLKKMLASGFVVNCQSKVQYEQLRSAIDIPMTAVNGRDFANTFHLKYYPVLVTSEEITQ